MLFCPAWLGRLQFEGRGCFPDGAARFIDQKRLDATRSHVDSKKHAHCGRNLPGTLDDGQRL